MIKKIVYSKHSPDKRCGVAYFSNILAKHISAAHIQSFYGFTKCDELFINMDILELDESEILSILNFLNSNNVRKKILIMHDYRFTYLEDKLVTASDVVINLSGEPALKHIAGNKMIELFTPSSTEQPILGFQKKIDRPLSLAFGFFSPRKKTFKTYTQFYEYMLSQYPQWYHILVVSAHAGEQETDVYSLSRLLDSKDILVLNFLPNVLLSELISAADLGVCFYPTGIMLNNAAPMAFFSQGKTVVTTYGELTPKEFKNFTLNISNLNKIDFSDLKKIRQMELEAKKYYWSNLSWDVFTHKMYEKLSHLTKSRKR